MNNPNQSDSSGKLEKDEIQRFLTFLLGQEEYAVPLLWVREVIGKVEITRVPFTPPHFLGILNLRGKIVSIIDLRIKFKMPNIKDTEDTSVIIADLGTHLLGVVVDSIDSVLTVKEGEVKPTPSIESSIGTDYITGVVHREDHLILLLDISRALNLEDHAAISKAQPPKAA